MAQYFPEIPTRIYVTGNIPVGQRYIGLARQRLDILFRSLELSGLPHGFNTLKLSDGTIIKASVGYGISNIDIYSPPVLQPTGGLVSIEKGYALFYARIEYSFFYDSFPRLVDGEIDRLVIWEVGSDEEGLIDTGEGEVILDVDVLRGISFVPDVNVDEDPEEYAQAISDAESYLDQITTREGPLDFMERYGNDVTSGAYDSFKRCTSIGSTRGAVTPIGSEMKLDEMYEGFSFYVEPYFYKNVSNPCWSGSWYNLYCSSCGADTIDNPTDIYDFIKYEDNYTYYGNRGYFQGYPSHLPYPGNEDYEDKLITDIYSTRESRPYDDFSHYERFASDCVDEDSPACVENGTDSGIPPDDFRRYVSGSIFARPSDANDTIGEYPCFFTIVSDNTYSDTSVGRYWAKVNTANKWVEEYLSYYFVDVGVSDPFTSDKTWLDTPLESLQGGDFMASVTAPDENEIDHASECYDVYNHAWVEFYPGSGWYELSQKDMPCNTSVYDPTYDREINPTITRKERYAFTQEFDYHFASAEYVNEENDNDKKYFTTLSFWGDIGYADRRAYTWEHSGGDWVWVNNGVKHYGGFNEMTPLVWHKVGVVIYIMNPSKPYDIDPDTGEKSNFWDIHSHRGSDGVINRNRVLDLEEYVNDLLIGYKNEVHDMTLGMSSSDPYRWWAMEEDNPDLYKSLYDFKFRFSTGFVYEVTQTAIPE